MPGRVSWNWADFPEHTTRRRLLVFCTVFLLAVATSLTYVYTPPAEYRAVSRLQISPARIVTQGDESTLPLVQDQPASFLSEVQVLTSRPLLEDTVDRLKNAG